MILIIIINKIIMPEKSIINQIKNEVHRVIIGKDDIIEYILVAIIARGHILLEGVPGIAKTKMANTLAKVLDLDFKRIQFTPDLLPSDITGTVIYNMSTREFDLKKGPIFTNLLLGDEINRASPKTQSALLECMQERQVTIGNTTNYLSAPFVVIATQNPLEMEGVYPLPEAQIDRFLFKLDITYPTKEEEMSLIKSGSYKVENINKIITAKQIIEIGEIAEKVQTTDEILDYIVNIVTSTRNNQNIYLGASPRASIAFLETSRVLALIEGRSYVIPDDIKKLAFPILRHRLILSSEAEMAEISPDQLISDILKTIPVPKALNA